MINLFNYCNFTITLFILVFRTKFTFSKPHIIFILVDDLGWNDVSFHGMREIQTPNIDDLASDSVVLNNYYVAPQCTPSRAALLSGLYPSRTGLQNNVIRHAAYYGLPLNLRTLPEQLNRLGYTSRIIGKWHLGFHKKEFTPTYRGFKSHYGYWTPTLNYYNRRSYIWANTSNFINVPPSLAHNPTIYLSGIDFRDDMTPVKEFDSTYVTDDLTNRAIRVIQDHNKSEPLFLFMSHQAPHFGGGGKRAPPGYEEEFSYIEDEERRQFAGVLRALDDSIGDLVQALSRQNMLENSVIVFSTDNGGDSVYITRSGSSNWPLRGQKFVPFEGGVRAVGFVWNSRMPGMGRVWNGLMHMVDWFPTLYQAAGGYDSDLYPLHLDGMSMWYIMFSEDKSPRTEVLLSLDPILNISAIRSNNYKLIYGGYPYDKLDGWYGTSGREVNRPKKSSTVASVLNEFYKQPADSNLFPRPFKVEVSCNGKTKPTSVPTEPVYLFNLNEDPCETENLASKASLRPIIEIMLASLKAHEKNAVPPLNTPFDYRSNPDLHDGMWSPWLD